MASNNNNVYNDQQRTLLNPSHLKRADVDNGTGKIIWARDIDWGDISSSFKNLNSLFIISKLEELINRVTDLENQISAPQTIYYWYAGQTDPSTMSSISPIVTSYENGGGWYELGTTLPTSIDQLIKGGTAGNIWYTAVPADSHLVPGSSADPDTSVNTGPTKVFNGVTYQIYIYEGVTGTRGSFELNT